MKHLLIALVILAVCLAFCIWSCLYVRNVVAPVLDTLRLARTHARNGAFAAAADKVEQAAAVWSRYEGIFGVLLRHDETDEVQRSFAALRENAMLGNPDDFAADCARLIFQLQHLRSMQLPTASNIF